MLSKGKILRIIGRKKELFFEDINNSENKIRFEIERSKFIVLGGAGSIGQAVVKEIFKRNPLKLHVIDISENNLVELVRDLRSEYGYIKGEFRTFCLDIGSKEFETFWNCEADYDYVLNLSALKHVRSEKDKFTLMRMIETNIFNTIKTIHFSINSGVKKYFCVSTDKAANPVNMMGASKKIMELFAYKYSNRIKISMARFANVAFSDGSLLYSFEKRLEKNQPIVAPDDIERYFVIPKESGELCLMSCLFGDNRDIFFPKLTEDFNLVKFSLIAKNYLKLKGYSPKLCLSEIDARKNAKKYIKLGLWPCLFTKSDTTGEKAYEEFFTSKENIDYNSFLSLGIIKNELTNNSEYLDHFIDHYRKIISKQNFHKKEIINLFKKVLPDFQHVEKLKSLDSKM